MPQHSKPPRQTSSPDDSLRILHIAPGEPFGGVQRIVLNLAEQQLLDNNTVGVIWTGEANRALAQMPSGVESFHASGALPKRIAGARKSIKAFPADVIHVHMAPAWAAIALAGISAPVFFHLHGQAGPGRANMSLLTRLLERWLINRSCVLIAISDWIEREWEGRVPNARFEQVLNGVPCTSEPISVRSITAGKPPIIGFASRLAPDKGVAEFAAFVLALHQRLPEGHFLIAGAGPEQAMLMDTLGELIAQGKVELLGHVTDMRHFWQQLDLAIFCAPAEPFGLRLLEPVANSVPVIAYETGAGSDEICRNCAGIAMVPYERVDQMADLAVKLLNDQTQRERMAVQGMKDLEEHFSIASMAQEIEAVYRAHVRTNKG